MKIKLNVSEKIKVKNKKRQSHCNCFEQCTVKIEIAFAVKVRSNEKRHLIENKSKSVVINLKQQKYLLTLLYTQLLRYYYF